MFSCHGDTLITGLWSSVWLCARSFVNLLAYAPVTLCVCNDRWVWRCYQWSGWRRRLQLPTLETISNSNWREWRKKWVACRAPTHLFVCNLITNLLLIAPLSTFIDHFVPPSLPFSLSPRTSLLALCCVILQAPAMWDMYLMRRLLSWSTSP